jgi:glycosyl transferase family 25
VVKLEHYGPPGQRVLLTDMRAAGPDFQLGRMLSRHTGAAAYILSRPAAELLLSQTRFDLPVDHLLFNPNNSLLFARLRPWQLLPAIARQEEFVGEKSDIENTRVGLRSFGLTYAKRELVRFGYDLKLVPQQISALLGGAKFVAVTTAA